MLRLSRSNIQLPAKLVCVVGILLAPGVSHTQDRPPASVGSTYGLRIISVDPEIAKKIDSIFLGVRVPADFERRFPRESSFIQITAFRFDLPSSQACAGIMSGEIINRETNDHISQFVSKVGEHLNSNVQSCKDREREMAAELLARLFKS